jgi:DNA-directed RNA polymerase subunit F
MIKARKGDLLILGLSDKNMARLKKDEPIKFKLNEIMPELKEEITVIIMNGRTEATIALSLKQMSNPQN